LVNPVVIVALGLGFIFFAGRGGLESISAFVGGLRGKELLSEAGTGGSRPSPLDPTSIAGHIPTNQKGKTLGSEIPSGSASAVSQIAGSKITQVDIATKTALSLQRFKSRDSKIPSSIEFFRLQQANQLSNISTGQKITLSELELQGALTKPFSALDKRDIAALDLRRQQSDFSGRKLSGSDVVLQKRLEAAKATKVLGAENFVFSGGVKTRSGALIETKGGLFGSPDFALGGVSQATFLQQQADKSIIDANRAANQARADANIGIGNILIQEIESSGQSQKDFLLASGINLTGSDLNARALGRLQEQGLIWVL